MAKQSIVLIHVHAIHSSLLLLCGSSSSTRDNMMTTTIPTRSSIVKFLNRGRRRDGTKERERDTGNASPWTLNPQSYIYGHSLLLPLLATAPSYPLHGHLMPHDAGSGYSATNGWFRAAQQAAEAKARAWPKDGDNKNLPSVTNEPLFASATTTSPLNEEGSATAMMLDGQLVERGTRGWGGGVVYCLEGCLVAEYPRM